MEPEFEEDLRPDILVQVWDLNAQQFVQLQSWMQYCPWINSKHLKLTAEQWECVPPRARKLKKRDRPNPT